MPELIRQKSDETETTEREHAEMMNEQMEIKISVIMGIYNPEDKQQLMRAVQSIISQTFTDWELILCDDGSNENQALMIRETAEMDPRIRLIRNKTNLGLGYSLNQCLSIAKGIYIARMDGDDISLPERLEKEYQFLEKHPEYQWVGSNSELFDEHGAWGIDQVPECPVSEDFLAYSPYIHPSVMFRKDVLRKEKGYRISETTRRCEDYELFMRLHKAGYRGYNIQETLLRYREDENTYKKRTLQSRIREMKVRYHGFQQLGILRPDTVAYVVRPLAAGAVSPIFLRYVRQNMRKDCRVDQREHQM